MVKEEKNGKGYLVVGGGGGVGGREGESYDKQKKWHQLMVFNMYRITRNIRAPYRICLKIGTRPFYFLLIYLMIAA